MSFTREQKRINEQVVFNPPPGYYDLADNRSQHKQMPAFGLADRFHKQEGNRNPGPGAYHNHQKDAVKKRLIEESLKREGKGQEGAGPNGIKISSIPSIPKKSATRVYEELAPGILILHEQDYESTTIGPGSYNLAVKATHPKAIAHRIAPEHAKRRVEEEATEVTVPTLAEQIRNQKRLMNKQNLIKTSTVNKSEINPSDLCLEVIILREKLLRSDQNPPPGYYHTDHLTDFKTNDDKKPVESQCLGGKEKRFDNKAIENTDQIGPGTYVLEEGANRRGGFIPKQTRHLHQARSEEKPGPGTYITIKNKPKTQTKGNYPPIFGSGIHRFPSAPKAIESMPNPGPGSYKLDKKRPKKQKYIKIRKELIEPSREEVNMQPLTGIQNETSLMSNMGSLKQRKFYKYQKNSSNFASNVQRFQNDRTLEDKLGPGNYTDNANGFNQRSFNRKQQDGYIGNRMTRFDQSEIRPKIGPGTYNPGYETVKETKVKNIFL